MNFTEAYEQMKIGKRVHRKGWIATEYGFDEENYLTNYCHGKKLPVLLTKIDLDATDWEVVE